MSLRIFAVGALINMPSILRQYRALASPHRACAECGEKCKGTPLCVCTQCDRVYHDDCYATRSTSTTLDCNCNKICHLVCGRPKKCVQPGCHYTPERPFWICRGCKATLEKCLLDFLLNDKANGHNIDVLITMFLRSVKSPFHAQQVDTNNIKLNAFKVALYSILATNDFVLFNLEGSTSIVCHYFKTMIQEMKENSDFYDLPLQHVEFDVLRELPEDQGGRVAKSFQIYLRHMASIGSNKLQYAINNGKKQIRYTSDLHFVNKDELLQFLKDRGYQGMSKIHILATYRNAVYDLTLLEQSGMVWMNGDRSMVYHTSCCTGKIHGLHKIWHHRHPSPTKT